jgi:hypothetical protein
VFPEFFPSFLVCFRVRECLSDFHECISKVSRTVASVSEYIRLSPRVCECLDCS